MHCIFIGWDAVIARDFLLLDVQQIYLPSDWLQDISEDQMSLCTVMTFLLACIIAMCLLLCHYSRRRIEGILLVEHIMCVDYILPGYLHSTGALKFSLLSDHKVPLMPFFWSL